MQKAEVITFMKKIKAYYQTFSMEDYIVAEWQDRLKPYDLEDVYAKLDQHLNGELKDQIPKLHYITKYLKTSAEKKMPSIDYLVDCNLCQRTMRLSEYNNHYDKCLSIKCLLTRLKKQGQEVAYEELEDLYDSKRNTYDRVYEKYMNRS